MSDQLPRPRRHPKSIKVGTWEHANIKCPPANKKTGSECIVDTREEEDGRYDHGARQRTNKQIYMRAKRRKEECQK